MGEEEIVPTPVIQRRIQGNQYCEGAKDKADPLFGRNGHKLIATGIAISRTGEQHVDGDQGENADDHRRDRAPVAVEPTGGIWSSSVQEGGLQPDRHPSPPMMDAARW
jgi:hypothetical protein